MEVTQALPDLCLDCHETIKDDTTAAYRHPAVLGERACLTCHTAHGSDLARLMSDLPVRICMTCHDKEIEMEAGGVVAAVAEINDPNLFKHSPIRDGQCGGCHSTHGGDKPLLLRGAVSKEFYQRFSAAQYDLCFSCHDERLAESEQAQGLTNFRNGDRNLHFVHIDQGSRGRGCSVCHRTHASQGDQLIRAWVPYGEWQLPISFTKTNTGGDCETGCHQQFPYDRINPVINPSLGFTQSPRVPRADQETPTMVAWSVQDISGTTVTVPVDQRPSVLLFVRAEQVQSHQVIKMVSAVTPGRSKPRKPLPGL
jgi:predicted CXXCH cytochrome family protein